MFKPNTVFTSIAAVTLLLGCSFEEDLHDEHVTVDEPVSLLAVDVGSGDVEVIGADVSKVTVYAWVNGDRNHLGHKVSNGRLELFDICRDSPCSVDIQVTAPRALVTDLRTGSGDVRLANVNGGTFIDTGSGDVFGSSIATGDLSVSTGSGDVTLGVRELSGRAWLRTGSGDVELGVPRGSYRVSLSTGSGDRHIDGITSDPNAATTIEVSTGSGDVSVRGR